MKKLIAVAVLLAVIMATITFTGCLGGGSNSGTPATNAPGSATEGIDTNAAFELRIIGSLDGEERTELLKEAERRLQKKWPNVTIANENSGDYQRNLKLDFSSGQGQELAYLDDLNQQMLESGNYLMDITSDIIERGWIDKSVEGAVEFNNLRHPDINYSVPFLMSPVLTYYNKDIFEELNLSLPKTVDEFTAVLDAANRKGYVGVEVAGTDEAYQIPWMIYHMVQNSASKSDVDDWYYMRNSSDSMKRAFIQAYTTANDWYKAGYFREGFEGVGFDDVNTLFSQGKTALVVGGDWDIPELEMSGLNVGVFIFPPINANPHPYIVNAVDGAWALNANLNATQKAAALDWIDIFFEPDFVAQWYDIGFTPTVKGEFSSDSTSNLKKEATAVIEGTQMGYFLDNVKDGFLDHVITTTQRMYQGELTPEGVWDALDAEWQRED
jgi:ABC-type glycerol-3-phosphate transport system substrate-binding protein